MGKRYIKKKIRPLLNLMRPGNIMMIHIGRCGSTVLASLMRQHPKIYWASELYEPIFSQWRKMNNGVEVVGKLDEDAIHILKKSMKSALHRYYGFEIKPYHFNLINYKTEDYIKHTEKLGIDRYIILDRKNKLRTVISSVIAQQNEKLYFIDSKTKPTLNQTSLNTKEININFDSKPLIQYLSDYTEQITWFEQSLKNKKLLKLNYEDDIQDDPNVAYRKVCDFLNVKPIDFEIKYSRTNPFAVNELIENFNDVEKELVGTPYEWMLND